MGVRENKVERYLHEQVEALGGTTWKWVSPGMAGVPDRIVTIAGRTWFVEVKTVDGSLSPQQERRISTLHRCGQRVHVVYGTEQVDTLIDIIKSYMTGGSDDSIVSN